MREVLNFVLDVEEGKISLPEVADSVVGASISIEFYMKMKVYQSPILVFFWLYGINLWGAKDLYENLSKGKTTF